MKIVADTHTHTIANDHAFSTLLENIDYARRAGMQAIAVTEHAMLLPDSPHEWHHHAVARLPQYHDGLMLLGGIELDAVSDKAELELDPVWLKQLQWVILSCHSPVIPPDMGQDYYTAVYESYAKTGYIDCLGHCGNPRFPFDIDRVVSRLGQYGVAVEINNHSFAVRTGSGEQCRQIALACKKYGVPIVVSSDAHFAPQIGVFPDALAMLAEIDFPEPLVLNADLDRLVDFINSKPHKENKIQRS